MLINTFVKVVLFYSAEVVRKAVQKMNSGIDITVKNKKFNTHPVVFHHPGHVGSKNNIFGIIKIKKKLFSVIGKDSSEYFCGRKELIRYKIPSVQFESSRKVKELLTVVAITNLDEPGSGPRSLKAFGIDCKIFGRGVKKWSNIQKIRLLKRELSNINTKYIMLLDSDDTFVVDGLDRVIEKIESMPECKLLMNAAQNFWPPILHRKSTTYEFCNRIGDEKKSRHRYVNSGVFISEVEFLKDLLEEDIAPPKEDDDQGLFCLLYQKYYPAFQLDYYCDVFQCEFDEELIVESNSLPLRLKIYFHTESKLYPILSFIFRLRQFVLRVLLRQRISKSILTKFYRID
jgi:hypothetical protein